MGAGKRNINTLTALALAVSLVVGTGVFGLVGLCIGVSGIEGSLLGWLLAMVAMVPFVHILKTLGIKFRSSLGVTHYAREAFGSGAGSGVSLLLCGTFVILVTTVSLLTAPYMELFLNLPEGHIPLIAASIMTFVLLVNLAGTQVMGVVSKSSLAVILGLTALMICFHMQYATSGFESVLLVATQALHGNIQASYTSIWQTSAIVIFTLVGWESLSFILAEFKNGSKIISRVHWFGYLIVVCIYLSIIAVAMGASKFNVNIAGVAGIGELISTLPFGYTLGSVLVVIFLANACSYFFTTSRMLQAASMQRILPKMVGLQTSKRIPAVACLLIYLASVTLILAYASGLLSLPLLLKITGQSLIVIYIICLAAYWKTTEGYSKWAGTLAGALASIFFLAGADISLLFPIALFVVGYGRHRVPERAIANLWKSLATNPRFTVF